VRCGWIPVGRGALTDRRRLWGEKKRTNQCYAWWKTAEPVELTFDLAASRELAEANVFVSGAVGVVGLSLGGSARDLKPAGVVQVNRVVEGVEKVSFRPAGRRARFVRFAFGPRPAGGELVLAEAEVWQK